MLGSDAVLQSIAKVNHIYTCRNIPSETALSLPEYRACMSTLMYLISHGLSSPTRINMLPLVDALTSDSVIKLVAKALQSEDRRCRSFSKCIKFWTSPDQCGRRTLGKYFYLEGCIRHERLTRYSSAVMRHGSNPLLYG